jgi:hypothetical protein
MIMNDFHKEQSATLALSGDLTRLLVEGSVGMLE